MQRPSVALIEIPTMHSPCRIWDWLPQLVCRQRYMITCAKCSQEFTPLNVAIDGVWIVITPAIFARL